MGGILLQLVPPCLPEEPPTLLQERDKRLKLGSSEMTLVLHTVSKVTKSRSTLSVCTTDTITSHLMSIGTPGILLRKYTHSRKLHSHPQVSFDRWTKSWSNV